MTLRLRAVTAFYVALIYVFLIASPATISAQTDTTGQVFEREDAYIARSAGVQSFRGAVLVGVDGKIVFEKAYGPADEEWNLYNNTTTKFRIASLTKQFTAACILMLQERRLLNVQDPISRYISGLPAAWQTITIHQLLTHTSGVPNYTNSPLIAKLNRTGASPQELISLVKDKPLDFKPGAQWNLLKYRICIARDDY